MGGAHAKETNPDVLAAISALGPERVSHCHALFADAVRAGAGDGGVDAAHLASALQFARGLPSNHLAWVVRALEERVGPDIAHPRRGHGHRRRGATPSSDDGEDEGGDDATAAVLSERGFIVLVHMLGNADRDARRIIFFSAIARPGNALVKDADAGAVEELLRVAADEDFAEIVDYLKWEALKSPGKAGALGELEPGLSEDGFATFLDRCPLAEALLNELFVPPDGIGRLIDDPLSLQRVRGGPRCIRTRDDAPLTSAQATALEWVLPLSKQGRWELLFLSKRDGASFQRMRHCVEGKGSTVAVIRDDGGHVFGAFASAPWEPKPQWFGSDACFLFSVRPSLRVYRATAVNSNYQYFNFMQETVPNGLAMGGQFGYFGLHVSEAFDSGHCKGHPLSSTYGNPVMSHSEDFRVEDIVIWRVGPEEKSEFADDDEDEDDHHGAAWGAGGGSKGAKKTTSILDKSTDDRAVLELAGKKMHSTDLRDPELDAEPVYREDGKVKRPVY